MKRIFVLFILFFFTLPVNAFGWHSPERAVKNVINSQIKYANQGNFDKFISTYDSGYVNADGFNLEIYSKLVKEIWNSFNNIKYGIKIKDIKISNNKAIAEVTEYTNAYLALSKSYTGKLDSKSESVYYLKKVNGKWKVYSDSVLDETTTMLYGEAKDLDVKLSVPLLIEPNTEYTAALELITPKNMVAIASITSEKVEYPQKQSKEVFRPITEDHILERLFTSNNENLNEYIIASIGLTQTDICDLSIKMSLAGFGYILRRVNVMKPDNKEVLDEQN